MNKFLSFVSGAFCGSIVGAVAVLLLTPASGAELQAEARRRWEEALTEAKRAEDATRLQMEQEFNQLTHNHSRQ